MRFTVTKMDQPASDVEALLREWKQAGLITN